MFDAWGAQTDDEEIDRNKHVGIESSFDWAPNYVATGNVTFFPKVDVLVINNDVLAELSEDQRSLLVEAAEAARDSVIASAQTDAEKAIEFCAAGGSIVLAEERDVSALRDAAAQVYAELQQDSQTAELIEAIRLQAVPSAAEPAVQPCGTRPSSGASGTSDPAQLNGVYRFEITDKELAAEGITDPAAVLENHGVFTWTFDDGAWCYVQKADNAIGDPSGCSTYSVSGDELTLTYPDGASETWKWSRNKAGDLTFEVVETFDDLTGAFVADPWVFVKDVD